MLEMITSLKNIEKYKLFYVFLNNTLIFNENIRRNILSVLILYTFYVSVPLPSDYHSFKELYPKSYTYTMIILNFSTV